MRPLGGCRRSSTRQAASWWQLFFWHSLVPGGTPLVLTACLPAHNRVPLSSECRFAGSPLETAKGTLQFFAAAPITCNSCCYGEPPAGCNSQTAAATCMLMPCCTASALAACGIAC